MFLSILYIFIIQIINKFNN